MCGIDAKPLQGSGQQCKGFSLLRLMVAVVLFLVGVIGLIGGISSSAMVDSVTQEHNLALDGAREVIERIKSEPFDALEARTQSPSDDSVCTSDISAQPVVPDNTDVATGNQNSRNPRANAQAPRDNPPGMAMPAVTDGGSASNAASWFDIAPGGLRNGTEIDAEGNFEVPGLMAWDDDPDGKVGKATVKRIADDRAEASVTVRWHGRRGRTEIALRCRIPDWQRFDAR